MGQLLQKTNLLIRLKPEAAEKNGENIKNSSLQPWDHVYGKFPGRKRITTEAKSINAALGKYCMWHRSIDHQPYTLGFPGGLLGSRAGRIFF